MSAIVEVAEYLEDQGVGTVGTNIILGGLPADGTDVMALVQYPGREPEIHLSGDGSIKIEFPRLQFVVRGSTDLLALSKAQAAYVALAKVANQMIEGVFYSNIRVLQSPGLLYYDKNERPVYGFNMECEKAVS